MMFKKEINFRGRKLTIRDLILLVAALVMVVLYIAFNNLNTSATDEKVKLETRVSRARADYNEALKKSDDIDALKQQITQLQKNSAVFPGKEEGGELISLLWGWAEESGLQIPKGLTSVSGSAKLGEVEYLSNTVSIGLRGTAEQLTEFFRHIKGSDIATIVVSNMSADNLSPDWTMDMQVIVYIKAS